MFHVQHGTHFNRLLHSEIYLSFGKCNSIQFSNNSYRLLISVLKVPEIYKNEIIKVKLKVQYDPPSLLDSCIEYIFCWLIGKYIVVPCENYISE